MIIGLRDNFALRYLGEFELKGAAPEVRELDWPPHSSFLGVESLLGVWSGVDPLQSRDR